MKRRQQSTSKRDSNQKNINQLLGKPDTLAEKFHEKTKNKESSHELDPKDWPEEWKKVYFKGYARLPEVKLPKPHLSNAVSLKNSLLQRKSERNFSIKPVSLNELSTLLFYSAGLNNNSPEEQFTNRFYPSGGARYPLEVYILSLNTELPLGLYHYYVRSHSLELLLPIKSINCMDYFISSQKWISSAAAIVFITAVFKRSTVKYGNRGYRLILQESGHLAQNLYLVSSGIDLACCATAGFIDDKVADLLDIDGLHESVVHALAIGNR